MSPYVILGVGKDASAAAIKKAYRKLAMEKHPDRGGDPVAWQPIADAWAVLSDPKRRAKYDETGSTEKTVDSSHMRMLILLNEAMVSVVAMLAEQRREVRSFDMVAGLRQWLKGAKDGAKKKLSVMYACREKLTSAEPHYHSIHEENILRAVSREQIRTISIEIQQWEERAQACRDALTHLDGCTYDWIRAVNSCATSSGTCYSLVSD